MFLANLSDLKCDTDIIERVATNLIIILDTDWEYYSIQAALA